MQENIFENVHFLDESMTSRWALRYNKKKITQTIPKYRNWLNLNAYLKYLDDMEIKKGPVFDILDEDFVEKEVLKELKKVFPNFGIIIGNAKEERFLSFTLLSNDRKQVAHVYCSSKPSAIEKAICGIEAEMALNYYGPYCRQFNENLPNLKANLILGKITD